MIIQIETGALIQGVSAAVAIIALMVVYFDRMSSVSNDISTISDSIDNVHSDIQEVDLKHMERTTNKLETFLEAELTKAYNGRETTGGQNSVRHTLSESEIGVTISYVGNPQWHTGLRDADNGDEIVFEVKFDEEVDTQGLVGLLVRDENLAERDRELFASDDPRITADSPFQISASVPTEDMEIAGKWIQQLIESTDQNIRYIRNQQSKFDETVENII